jgi:hypothetical protein
VIAVIELSAKVSLLCLEYYDAVKNAKSDIKRLCGELDRLKITIEGAQNLLESPNGARLSISQQLRDGLAGCFSQLTGLQTRLEQKLHPGTRQKLMRHFGRSALKWPFESKDVDKLVSTLERYRDTLAGALIIDQTHVTIESALFHQANGLQIRNPFHEQGSRSFEIANREIRRLRFSRRRT